MKKMMMGASALAIASVSGAAVAQEWSVGLSGGTVSGFGYVDTDVVRHNELLIHRADATLNARLVADNGLTFSADITFRVDGDENIGEDGYNAAVSGSFGTVRVGRHSGVQRTMLPRTPRTTFAGAGRGGGILFDGDYNRGEVPAGVGDDRGANLGFSQKITYTTPRFSGFQAGVSYGPGIGSTNIASTPLNEERPREGLEFGANYRGDFSGFTVAVGGGYTTFLNDGPLDAGWAVGAEVGYMGFALGATYGYSDFDTADDVATLAVGARYRTGPWSFGLSYGINIDGQTIGNSTTTRNRQDDWGISGAVDYALAPGVTVGLNLEYSQADVDVTTASGTDDSAFAAGVFMGLSF